MLKEEFIKETVDLLVEGDYEGEVYASEVDDLGDALYYDRSVNGSCGIERRLIKRMGVAYDFYEREVNEGVIPVDDLRFCLISDMRDWMVVLNKKFYDDVLKAKKCYENS